VPVPRSGRVPAGCRALPLAYDGIPRPYFESQMDEAMVGQYHEGLQLLVALLLGNASVDH
jgi:hypothetical protein